MLKQLELKNWRTHQNSTLDFDTGTNVIIGVMGSGKSSIVNAISYALFGTFPALKSKQVSLQEILMNKPNQCSEADVKLVFTHADKEYSVERKLFESKTNEAKLFEGKDLIAGPKQKDVNEKIEHLLGLSYELFSRAIYAEQNEMDFFLKLSPGERKKKFDELLDLEKYENARKNALGLKNSLLKENAQREEYIKQQKIIIKDQEGEKVELQIKKENEELRKIEKELVGLEKQVKEKKTLFEKLKLKEKEAKEINDLILKNKTTIETITNIIAKEQDIDLEKLLGKKKEIDVALTEKKGVCENISKQRSEMENAENKASAQIKVFEFREKEIEKEVQEINKLQGACPTCKQELTIAHKSEIKEKLLNEQKKISKEKNDLKNKQKELIEGKSFFEKQIMDEEKVIEKLRKELYEIENNEKNAKRLLEKKKELSSIEKELPKLESKLKEIDFDEKIMLLAQKEFFEISSKESSLESQIKSKKELIQSHTSSLEKIKTIQKNLERMETESTTSKNAAEKLSMFEGCLISTQFELREAMLETINTAMSNIWETLYPYKDFTDARLCVVENGYDLQVLNRNKDWVRVEGILSGGERSAAALCIRIAFALVLTKQLSLLILDEPTHNLDSNSVTKLSEMLRESLPGLVEQIFVITHDKQMESAASSSLYLLHRNKDLDSPTQTEVLPIT
jgi:DNA repair protein SbcC/Rad50